jgi:hypothetical protein
LSEEEIIEEIAAWIECNPLFQHGKDCSWRVGGECDCDLAGWVRHVNETYGDA